MLSNLYLLFEIYSIYRKQNHTIYIYPRFLCMCMFEGVYNVHCKVYICACLYIYEYFVCINKCSIYIDVRQ